MSRFTVPLPDGGQAIYGFDSMLSDYFVSHIDTDGNEKAVVGLLSGAEGSAGYCLAVLRRLGAVIPEAHQIELMGDMPLSEVPTDNESAPMPDRRQCE
jgi:hypothetical protein